MPTARGALAVDALPRADAGGRDGDIHNDAACLDELQALFIDADADEEGVIFHAVIIRK
jgi:hypothetical protein